MESDRRGKRWEDPNFAWGGQRRRRIDAQCRFWLNGSRGILNFFSHLTDHVDVCLDHFPIDLQMTVQGLDLHLWRGRVTRLGHEEWLLLLLLTLLVFREH